MIPGVKILKMDIYKDNRGSLMVSEFKKNLPFIPKRVFFIYNVPNNKVRGEHAHKKCKQFLVCIKGEVTVLVNNGKQKSKIRLNSIEKGLYISPMIWGSQYNYSIDAILLCFASENYKSSDYIRNYSEYLELIKLDHK